jgi:DNA-binding transcriptional regulator YiaG
VALTVTNSESCEDEPAILASGQSNDNTSGGDLPPEVEDVVDAKRGIGERITQARLQAGLAQVEVAERCGVSRSAVSNWECGQGVRSQKLVNMRVLSAPRSSG